MPVANNQPLAPATVRNDRVSHATANTMRDGTGTITALFAAGTSGSVVNRVSFVHGGAIGAASTAMVARLWATRSGTSRLIEEKALAAATPSASVIQSRYVFDTLDILLPSGDSLGITISVSEAVHFTAEGGDF